MVTSNHDSPIIGGSHEPALQRLSERSARHERRAGRWTSAWYAILIAGVIMMFLAAQGESNQVSKVVETERLILRDGEGRIRGEFSTGRDRSPTLWLFDQEGVRRAELSLLPNGAPGLRLFDEREAIRVDISLLEGQPTMSVRDKAGTDRAKLVVTHDGEPYFQLRDTTGNVIWSTPAHRLEVID